MEALETLNSRSAPPASPGACEGAGEDGSLARKALSAGGCAWDAGKVAAARHANGHRRAAAAAGGPQRGGSAARLKGSASAPATPLLVPSGTPRLLNCSQCIPPAAGDFACWGWQGISGIPPAAVPWRRFRRSACLGRSHAQHSHSALKQLPIELCWSHCISLICVLHLRHSKALPRRLQGTWPQRRAKAVAAVLTSLCAVDGVHLCNDPPRTTKAVSQQCRAPGLPSCGSC